MDPHSSFVSGSVDSSVRQFELTGPFIAMTALRSKNCAVPMLGAGQLNCRRCDPGSVLRVDARREAVGFVSNEASEGRGGGTRIKKATMRGRTPFHRQSCRRARCLLARTRRLELERPASVFHRGLGRDCQRCFLRVDCCEMRGLISDGEARSVGSDVRISERRERVCDVLGNGDPRTGVSVRGSSVAIADV